jgi:TetR/AcrR family transcriptional regulator, cholesterol catabolism regulator
MAAITKSTRRMSPPASGEAGSPPTRARIVAGARRHFFAHGFRGVTMDDLALEMSMSKKTLYVHFPSKTALLEAVLEDKLARAEADFQQAMSAGEFSGQLPALLTCVRAHGEEIQPPFIRDMQREAPELFARVQRGRAVLIQRYFGQLFAAGQKAGRIRKDVRTDFLVEMLIGAVNGVLNPQKIAELGLAPKVAFTKVIAVFLEGVAAKGGRPAR